MDKPKTKRKLETELLKLSALLKAIKEHGQEFTFLMPAIGNAVESSTDILTYLYSKNVYYPTFKMGSFNNRLRKMHRNFLTDLHQNTETGLIRIIKKQKIKVKVNKKEALKSLIAKIKRQLLYSRKLKTINPELEKILKLTAPKPSFNDNLNAVLENISGISDIEKQQSRNYFDAINILRNKVSHPNSNLTRREKDKLIQAKLGRAISKNGKLIWMFEFYEPILADIIKFFKRIFIKINQ
jgi:hypothetical protein